MSLSGSVGLKNSGGTATQLAPNATGSTLVLSGSSTALQFISTQAAGSDAFKINNNGARWHIGTGTTDYFTSDGASTIIAAGGLQAASLSASAGPGSGGLTIVDTTNTRTFYLLTNNNVTTAYNNAVQELIKFDGALGIRVVAGSPAASSTMANVIGTLQSDTTVNGSGADTSEDNLTTYSLPANVLATNGRGVRITAWGDGVSTADTTTIRCYFGATAVLTIVLTASQANTWRAVFEIIRTGAATQVATGTVWNGGTATKFVQANASPSETLSGAVTLKCTGQRAVSSVANSLRQLGLTVEYI
jgi:hypothetical protein